MVKELNGTGQKTTSSRANKGGIPVAEGLGAPFLARFVREKWGF